MKKTFLLLSISAFSFANAQSITVNDTLRTGDKAYYFEAIATAPNLDAVIGANVTWDYSTLTLANTNGAVKDSVIQNTNADYSNAFHQEQFDGGINAFFTNTPTEVTSYGFVFDLNGQNAKITYSVDPLQAMVFPMAFGTTDYTDNISGNIIVDAIPTPVAVSGTAAIKADGTGTLTLGTTTFTDVIRIKTVEVLDGNVPAIPLIGFAGGPVNITRTSYTYYSLSDSRLPVFLHGALNAIVPTQPDVEQINVWSSVNLASASTGIELDEIATLSIFPNPATELVSIKSVNATSIHIFNAIGQEIYSITNPSNSETVNVSSFETGIYIVEVKNNETISTKKLIIE